MTYCSFCNEYETEGFFKSYCKNCAMLRRMLVIHNSEKCIEILKRVLIRNQNQIDHKINMELKRKEDIKDEKKTKESDDKKDYDTPKTRSQTNKA